MATAGYTTIGGTTFTAGTGTGTHNPAGLLITIPVGATISMITARVRMTSTSKNIVCKVYLGSAGSLGALQASTNAATVTSTEAWIDFPFATPFIVSATTYWIEFDGYGGDGPGTTVAQIKFDGGGGANTGYTKLDNQTAVFDSNQYSIYATYEPFNWNIALI